MYFKNSEYLHFSLYAESEFVFKSTHVVEKILGKKAFLPKAENQPERPEGFGAKLCSFWECEGLQDTIL